MLKPGTKHAPLPANAGEDSIARLDKLRNASGNLRTAEIRRNMQKIMQNNAAVFRTQETLAEGASLIDECVESFGDLKVGVLAWRSEQWRAMCGWLAWGGECVASVGAAPQLGRVMFIRLRTSPFEIFYG